MFGPGIDEYRNVLRRYWRVGLVALPGLALAAELLRRGRIPQARDYFGFVDGRTLGRVPNALNVLSNLAFAVVGIAGLWILLSGRARLGDPRERAPWLVFFGAVAATSCGSAWFHIAPSIDSLVWDRLPMAVAFMALLSALIAERIGAAAGARLLAPLTLAGLASVPAWWWTEHIGAGDLRPYLLVQFYPLLAVPVVLALFPARYSHSGVWLVSLGAYLLAKGAEVADEAVFRLGGIVSGHTLKHLLAAAGIGALAAMLALRRPERSARPAPARRAVATDGWYAK
ncbi:MAG TPA: hypothetical protein VFP65_02025 [Anaeromyxobacteraceae bacterium]|nr:hypothetical protein [Anaeromyxobacteraceae bacterium]